MGAIKTDNVIIVAFDEERHIETPPLYQYDKGIVLEFRDVPDSVDVQFSNVYTTKTINKVIINGVVTIPDSMLEQTSGIVAYIKYINANSEWTEKTLAIPVKQRQKPSDYIATEDEPSFRTEMQAIMLETKEIAEDAKDAIENLELTDEQIAQIAGQIDVSDKTNTFIGNGKPLGNASAYPSVKLGDIYIDKNNTDNVYIVIAVPSTNAVEWGIIPLQAYLNKEIEDALSKFDTELSGYVPTSRKVANRPLTEDVTSLQIIDAILGGADSLNRLITGIDYHLLGGKGSLQTEDKVNYVRAINEVNAIAKENKDNIENLDFLKAEDLLDRVRIYTGTSAPLRATSHYPDVKVGDIYINTNDTDHFYMAIIISGSAMTWAAVPNVSGLFKDIYNKKEVDTMFSAYDTSEVVDEKISTAITEALNNIPIAEGSEF